MTPASYRPGGRGHALIQIRGGQQEPGRGELDGHAAQGDRFCGVVEAPVLGAGSERPAQVDRDLRGWCELPGPDLAESHSPELDRPVEQARFPRFIEPRGRRRGPGAQLVTAPRQRDGVCWSAGQWARTYFLVLRARVA